MDRVQLVLMIKHHNFMVVRFDHHAFTPPQIIYSSGVNVPLNIGGHL